jgi:hypothetical protein
LERFSSFRTSLALLLLGKIDAGSADPDDSQFKKREGQGDESTYALGRKEIDTQSVKASLEFPISRAWFNIDIAQSQLVD